jgi:hypothetical protein
VVPTVAIATKVVASIMCTVLISRAGNVRRFQDLYSYAAYLGLISSAVADIWNTSVLCLCLQLRRTDHTRNIVNWTMIWAVGMCKTLLRLYQCRPAININTETGLVTSVVTILVAVFVCTSAIPGALRATDHFTVGSVSRQCDMAGPDKCGPPL